MTACRTSHVHAGVCAGVRVCRLFSVHHSTCVLLTDSLSIYTRYSLTFLLYVYTPAPPTPPPVSPYSPPTPPPPGDFYVTCHSNLSETHVAFHLVVNEVPTAPIISSRHPIMAGLRNCLRAASRYSISLLTLPLLLVDKLGPVSVRVGVGQVVYRGGAVGGRGRVGVWECVCMWGGDKMKGGREMERVIECTSKF